MPPAVNQRARWMNRLTCWFPRMGLGCLYVNVHERVQEYCDPNGLGRAGVRSGGLPQHQVVTEHQLRARAARLNGAA